MKPAQEHFAAWIDSYWHKSESIPMGNIEGLSRAIENTASAGQLLNHINDTNAHRALFDELKSQIQAIQTILQVDDVNLDTLQEIVTELKANTKLQELIDKKVNKEEGKGLSANDFTNEHKQKLEGLEPTNLQPLQDRVTAIETTLSVDDTSLDTLQEIVTQVKNNKNLEQLLTGKVDKEGGKGLSANDFTNELKDKLERMPTPEDIETRSNSVYSFNYLREEIEKVYRDTTYSMNSIKEEVKKSLDYFSSSLG